MEIVLLATLLEREIFCVQLWCNIMIDRDYFKANIHARKVKGC